MTKRKYLRKRGDQAEIAEAVTQQQQRQKLKREIATLKRLPKDFRDITLGTDWEAFADITGRRKEMKKWWNGPILCVGKLSKSEEDILSSPNQLLGVKELTKLTQTELEVGAVLKLTTENWIKVIQLAETLGCSWIYLPDEELPIVTALNVLFSRFGANIRAKGQLISEHTGKPVGVVH